MNEASITLALGALLLAKDIRRVFPFDHVGKGQLPRQS